MFRNFCINFFFSGIRTNPRIYSCWLPSYLLPILLRVFSKDTRFIWTLKSSKNQVFLLNHHFTAITNILDKEWSLWRSDIVYFSVYWTISVEGSGLTSHFFRVLGIPAGIPAYQHSLWYLVHPHTIDIGSTYILTIWLNLSIKSSIVICRDHCPNQHPR